MTMRERMVRAAWESNRTRHKADFELEPWEKVNEETRAVWFGFIDAVLATLREPTEAMIQKGRFALEVQPSFTPEQGVKGCWQAMIDDAKEER